MMGWRRLVCMHCSCRRVMAWTQQQAVGTCTRGWGGAKLCLPTTLIHPWVGTRSCSSPPRLQKVRGKVGFHLRHTLQGKLFLWPRLTMLLLLLLAPPRGLVLPRSR